MELIKLEIISPDGVVFDTEVQFVTLPGREGEFGVLAGHAAVLSLLSAGIIRIEDKDSLDIQVAINGGYVHVSEEKVLCMVDGAIALSGKDTVLAKNIAKAKELLEKAGASKLTLSAVVSKI
ncbi:MAG: ATP synthase epsilon chain (EC [uncultured Sulfurovum sp.]|uniref:ATP synthase epsilon chain n=1 Tax=uncultured Sulfurovum sp. TaxID=269237 RepID=A0A6S6TTJ0_9BACT|nr:MAG: ATP synthase epsilon chain (EC [uncultured Sulfurovum sp.]